MKLINGKEVHVRTENDSTSQLLVRAMIGLSLWLACLYLIATNL